jgi:RNA polymerase sigma factor (sigma-70 family)
VKHLRDDYWTKDGKHYRDEGIHEPDNLPFVFNPKSQERLVLEQTLRAEIEALTGRQADCTKMYMLGEMSIRKIAAKLEVSAGTVQVYLERAKQTIQKRLAAKGIN